MSRKNFIALAAALKAAKPQRDEPGYAVWRRVVRNIADVCSDTNTRFDLFRFESACGIESFE